MLGSQGGWKPRLASAAGGPERSCSAPCVPPGPGDAAKILQTRDSEPYGQTAAGLCFQSGSASLRLEVCSQVLMISNNRVRLPFRKLLSAAGLEPAPGVTWGWALRATDPVRRAPGDPALALALALAALALPRDPGQLLGLQTWVVWLPGKVVPRRGSAHPRAAGLPGSWGRRAPRGRNVPHPPLCCGRGAGGGGGHGLCWELFCPLQPPPPGGLGRGLGAGILGTWTQALRPNLGQRSLVCLSRTGASGSGS